MRKRLFVGVASGLMLALCLGLYLTREPLHKGKPIGYWVDRACRGYDGNETWLTRSEVKDIGPIAVPRLVEKLRASDGWRVAYRWLRRNLLVRWPQRFPDVTSAEELHYGAVRTLALFGADAKPAVSDLTRLLFRMPHPVVEALTVIGPDASNALPALHLLLTNNDEGLRVEVAKALWHINRETNWVLEICTNALSSGQDAVNAGGLLMELQTAASPAVPFVLSALENTNNSIGMRANAAGTLGAARISTPQILTALTKGTGPNEAHILRSNCAMALWRIDSQYAPLGTRLVIESIIEQKRRFGNQEDFTKWLDVHGIDAQQAIPTLQALVESDSVEIRNEAAEALRRISAKR